MPSWKFFDCDVMLGNTLVPQPAPLLTPRDLLREMDRFGIERALVYHYHRLKSRMNRLTLDAAKTSPRLVPCWALSLTPIMLRENIEDHVDEMLRAGVKAARFVPDEGPAGGPMTLRLYQLEKVLARLDHHHVPVLIPGEHLQTPQMAATYGFDQIHDICSAFPNLPVVLLQVRYATQPPLLALMRRHANLYFTISWFGLFRQVESFVEMFGPERLLYGSGLPGGDPALGVGMVNYGKLTVAQKEGIAGTNLARLLEHVQ
ncbi:MAG TPA: amidohydrolase family protein [Bryobacteraceae bacterium]|nr:amidohydrolase family protein [Bryobacteraceae bacterium]